MTAGKRESRNRSPLARIGRAAPAATGPLAKQWGRGKAWVAPGVIEPTPQRYERETLSCGRCAETVAVAAFSEHVRNCLKARIERLQRRRAGEES